MLSFVDTQIPIDAGVLTSFDALMQGMVAALDPSRSAVAQSVGSDHNPLAIGERRSTDEWGRSQ